MKSLNPDMGVPFLLEQLAPDGDDGPVPADEGTRCRGLIPNSTGVLVEISPAASSRRIHPPWGPAKFTRAFTPTTPPTLPPVTSGAGRRRSGAGHHAHQQANTPSPESKHQGRRIVRSELIQHVHMLVIIYVCLQ